MSLAQRHAHLVEALATTTTRIDGLLLHLDAPTTRAHLNDAQTHLADLADLFAQQFALKLAQIPAELEAIFGFEIDADLYSERQLLDLLEALQACGTSPSFACAVGTLLDEVYGVMLVGPQQQLLADWLASSGGDPLLVVAIVKAIEAAARDLYAAISDWRHPNTGYLRPSANGVITPTPYLVSLETAGSASAAFRLVAHDGDLLQVTLSASRYLADATKLFGYLRGWEYAKVARRIIQIDHDLYTTIYHAQVASRFWNSQTWLPTANRLLRTDWSQLPGFAQRGIISIDPIHSLAANSPYDLIMAYRARSIPCTSAQADSLCHDSCYDPEVIQATNAPEQWAWAGTPLNIQSSGTGSYLPFLPSSILTGCAPARRQLAKGTIALWNEMGIYQDYEEVTRLVNLLEHRSVLPTSILRQTLFQFLHYIYHTIDTTLASREVEYVAAMTSIIVEYNNFLDIDARTYEFLSRMLTPVANQSGEFATYAIEYATEPLGFAWHVFDINLYLPEVKTAVQNGATRIFGSTEFNALSEEGRANLVSQKTNGEGWIIFVPSDVEYLVTSDSSPDGVFLMTPAQFTYAQNLK